MGAWRCFKTAVNLAAKAGARYPVSAASRFVSRFFLALFRLDIFVPATEGWHESITPLNERIGHEKSFLR